MDNWLPPVLGIITGVAIGILINRFKKKKTPPKKERINSSPVSNQTKAKQPAKKNKRVR